ncbi:cytochrome B561 [Sorangium cellulosum]|uniref:Cytochrome c oxidase subunit 2 n=2 Tax=Sorangium cellulosum TaxID=56 RepID=A0A4P2Q9A0_SORCE|nr:cytochrome B561 [Sorangium cellulosum]
MVMKNPIDLGSFWLPRPGSTLAEHVDAGWAAAYWVAVFFFVLVAGAVVLFAIKYRRRTERDKTSTLSHNSTIEVVWTVIPVAIVISLFFVGLRGYVHASVAPAESYEINVTGEMYLWTFTYPDGTTTINELAVPRGRPVRLIMSSKDIVHSFFIPEFRIKQDVVPGSYTTAWFEATETTETVLLCTEYCGSGHSDMLATVKVLEQSEFEKWLEGNNNSDLPPEELGKALFVKRSCATCHSLDGTRIQGPSLKGFFGREEELTDGSKVIADENYFRESLFNPAGQVVRGYPPVMPVFKGLLKDKEVDALIAYLKTVK